MRRLGPSSAFLETYSGRQAQDNRLVLLKRLSHHVRSTGRLVENIWAACGASMPPLVELGTSGDDLWLVTEGQEGESLRWVMSTLAKSAGFIAPNEGLAVVAWVGQALQTLHHQNAVHGDVCPATIFVTEQGQVQLHDGGLASTLGKGGTAGPFRSEINSLAPEQLSGPATAATDVFRLGLVLYELAIGRPLWAGHKPVHFCNAATHWQGLAPEKISQVPEPWLSLLVRMLAVNPAERPQMEEVLSILNAAMANNGWGSSAEDIARLFARANQARETTGSDGEPRDLLLSAPTFPSSPKSTRSVVARIATHKVKREAPPSEAPKPAAHAAAEQSMESRIGQLLVERGDLSPAQLTSANAEARMTKVPLTTLLNDAKLVTEDAMVAAIAELTRTPAITAHKMSQALPSAEALALIPLALSQATQAVPVGIKGKGQLLVAMVDPLDAEATAQLKAAIGAKSLIVFRAGPHAIARARERLYPSGSAPEDFELQVADPLPQNVRPLLRMMDTLLDLLGPAGVQAQQLVGLAKGLASRLAASEEQVARAVLAARGLAISALRLGRAPHEVPHLAQVEHCVGPDTVVAECVEAFHQFPTKFPEKAEFQAVVLAFAFTAHAGEPRPAHTHLPELLDAFCKRHHLSNAVREAFEAELEPGTSPLCPT